jgi:hypothetical protein
MYKAESHHGHTGVHTLRAHILLHGRRCRLRGIFVENSSSILRPFSFCFNHDHACARIPGFPFESPTGLDLGDLGRANTSGGHYTRHMSITPISLSAMTSPCMIPSTKDSPMK